MAPSWSAGVSRDFWKYWAGQTTSNLGSSFTEFILPLLIFKLTGSALNLAVSTALWNLPYLLFGLVIGAWVDRVDRRRLMIAVDVARAGVIATIPLLGAMDRLAVWWIYVVIFTSSTLTIFFNAAEFAAIPSLVKQDDLVTANGRIQASYSAANVLGPLLAGLAVAFLPIHGVLVFDAASFLVSAGSLTIIATTFNSGARRELKSIRHEVVEGLRYVLRHPVLRSISAMMALVNLVQTTSGAQIVLFAKERLQATDSEVGVLFSAGSAGVVVLGLLAGRLRRRWSFGTAALGALMLDGLLLVIFSTTTWYWLAVPLWAAMSGLGIFFNINTGSLRQAIVPNHLLGRIASIAMVLAWSANPVGALAGGWVIERTGNVALVYGVIGGLVFLIALGFYVLSPLGHAERYLPEAGEAGDGEASRPSAATPP